MNSLELLDQWISGKVKSWSSRVSGGAPAPELLEIRRDILRDVRDHIQPLGGGKFTFPYRGIVVHLGADTEPQLQLLQSAFIDTGDLDQDVRSLLSESGCRVPADFAVEAKLQEATDRPFYIDYLSNPSLPSKQKEVSRPRAKLTVLRGEADRPDCLLTSDRTYLGRMKEVFSETGSLRRRNDIAFAEAETTVSREHAFIAYHPETNGYRLHDSRSQRGTSVFRTQRQLRIPKGSGHGLELQSGDEIHLGEARLKFEIERS